MLALTIGCESALCQTEPRTARSFTANDGTRFVLVRDANVVQVHWAIASWADGRDDPPSLEGLARTTMRASLGGTWPTGSRDPDAERQALDRLDDAWQRQMAQPQNPGIAAEIVELDQAAALLGDSRTFRRALAAMPAHRPEVLERGPLAVLVLTTIDDAIKDIGRILVERREQQALRGLHRHWTRDRLARLDQHGSAPTIRLHAEILALQMPLAPSGRMLERPKLVAPSRAQAMATWHASQYPSRTVHVLLGAFDLDEVERDLLALFATTALPTPKPRSDFAPRPQSARRSSIVPGIPEPRLAISWVLPPNDEPWVVDVAGRWLAGDEHGWLQRRLRRQGRPKITVRCRAPWPPSEFGRGLLLLDLHDPSGKPGLIDAVLAACREVVKKPISDGRVHVANMTLQRSWNMQAENPRRLAAAIAAQAMLWPGRPVELTAPARVKGAPVYALLQRTFAGQPAIVEGQR